MKNLWGGMIFYANRPKPVVEAEALRWEIVGLIFPWVCDWSPSCRSSLFLLQVWSCGPVGSSRSFQAGVVPEEQAA